MYVRGFLLNKIVMILLLNFPCFLEIKIRRKQFQNIIVWSVYMVCCLRHFRKLLSYGENWRDEVAKVSIVKLYTQKTVAFTTSGGIDILLTEIL